MLQCTHLRKNVLFYNFHFSKIITLSFTFSKNITLYTKKSAILSTTKIICLKYHIELYFYDFSKSDRETLKMVEYQIWVEIDIEGHKRQPDYIINQ